jgi:hypothetical protein
MRQRITTSSVFKLRVSSLSRRSHIMKKILSIVMKLVCILLTCCPGMSRLLLLQ